ncbi:MAG: hypothetical protein FD179_1583 [Erysipelotrichaceae bacterium]|nr:MAG: hypothetical protein FD179_1583 [Erysipelotrichaceae bacterium]
MTRKIPNCQTPTDSVEIHFSQIQMTWFCSDFFISKSGRLPIEIYELLVSFKNFQIELRVYFTFLRNLLLIYAN